jgi:hypothetical protein
MIDARNAMAPKRHGGPAQSAGKGYVKAGRPDERQAFRASGAASGGAETFGSEPPVDVPFEEAPDVTQQQASDATVSTSADSAPEPESMPEPEPVLESEPAQPVAAEKVHHGVSAALEVALPATIEAAPAVVEGAVSASASLIGSVAGGLGLAALLGGGFVVIALGAALGAWHSVALANSYLSRR